MTYILNHTHITASPSVFPPLLTSAVLKQVDVSGTLASGNSHSSCPVAVFQLSTSGLCLVVTRLFLFLQRWNLMYQKRSYLSPPQTPTTRPTLEMSLTRGLWRGSARPAWR